MALRRFSQQVIIPGEEHSPQLSSAVQQGGILLFTAPVLVGRKHVQPAEAQAQSDRMRYMVIHVQGDGHGVYPLAFNRSTSGIGGVVFCT